MRHWSPLLAASLVLLCARQADAEPEPKDKQDKVQTLNVLGLSLAYQAPDNLDKDFTGGAGLVFYREYFVTRRTSLGPQLAPRFFPGSPFHFAFGYGLNFRHYVGSLGETERSGLYASYGLLMQLNWLEGSKGVAVGHDTKMGLGFDWSSERLAPTVEVNYHLTQVRSFDEETIWWPFTEVVFGARF